MATLYANFIWKGTHDERIAGVDARDGHMFMELDTGQAYFRRSGVWEFTEVGLSFVKATKSGRLTTDANGEVEVIFNTPFIDDAYSITLTCVDTGIQPTIPSKYDRTKDGFKIRTRNTRSGQLIGNIECSWLATRDYNV